MRKPKGIGTNDKSVKADKLLFAGALNDELAARRSQIYTVYAVGTTCFTLVGGMKCWQKKSMAEQV
jgi:hypothetical protein